MDNQALTKLITHQDKIVSQLEATLRVGALDNRGVLTSPRRALLVAQEISQAWFDLLAGEIKIEMVADLAGGLVEQGLSYNTAAGAMDTLHQSILEVTADDEALKLSTLLALQSFADTFLRKVAATREILIVQDQESYQASLQRALQTELSQVHLLTERLDRRQKRMYEVITIYSIISAFENELDILSHFADLAQKHLDLAGIAIFELAADQQMIAVRTSAGRLPETINPEATRPAGVLQRVINQNQPLISTNQDDSFYEVFIPLSVGRDKILGVLGLWATATESREDILEFAQPLAIMLATAWQNVRLLAQAEERNWELEALQGQRIQRMWASGQPGIKQTYLYDGVAVAEGDGSQRDDADLSLPIAIREQPIGHLTVPSIAGQTWTQDDLTFIEGVIREMSNALENARLTQDTQSRANRERTIREVTEKMRSAVNLEQLVKVTAQELGERFSAEYALVDLGVDSSTDQTPVSTNGQKGLEDERS